MIKEIVVVVLVLLVLLGLLLSPSGILLPKEDKNHYQSDTLV
jgi:hypothetical protein